MVMPRFDRVADAGADIACNEAMVLPAGRARIDTVARSARWPRHTLLRVPPLGVASELAARVRMALGLDDTRCVGIRALLREGGFVLREMDLRVGRGGHQALLQPLDTGFRICIDTSLSLVASTRVTRRHRARFRIAHEIGHSFFYDRSAARPRRLFPVGSAAEEDFCTEFARALLVPPGAVARCPAEASEVFSLAAKYDVSAELAARAFAGFHPGRPEVALAFWPHGGADLRRQWATSALSWAHLAGTARVPDTTGASQCVDPARRQIVAVFSNQ